ncbi:MBL fold metallo-hydrolase [Myxococcota bacterium]|nr:MBL fold metallo-hydrolase [Myxococcota bacterium]
MLLTVVGSADAFNASGRAHSSYLLQGEGLGTLMIDFGGTSLQALRRLGRSPRDVDALALTHLHGDHVGGLPFLFIDAMYNELRERPLSIVGPIHTRARFEALFRDTYGSVAERPRPFGTTITELLPGAAADVAGLSIEAFAAVHMDPPDQPLCLRITGPAGRVVAFSGDTELCDGLFAAAEGADLLVAECTALAPPAGRHSTWADWREALPRVGAKRVLFSHLGSDVRAKIPELLAEAPPSPEIAFADDGLVVIV